MDKARYTHSYKDVGEVHNGKPRYSMKENLDKNKSEETKQERRSKTGGRGE